MMALAFLACVVLLAVFLGMFVQLAKIHKAANSNMTRALNEIKELNGRLNAIATGLTDPGPNKRRK